MQDRNLLRIAIKQKRESLTNEEQERASVDLLSQLTAHQFIRQAQHIGVYLAHKSEIDLSPFIQWCWQHKKNLYLPVVSANNDEKGQMVFLPYQKNSRLIMNKYAIAEPIFDKNMIKPVEQLDVLLTPLVAFDSSGARLGMGGGYYDRALSPWYDLVKSKGSELLTTIKPYPIGVAHICQQFDTLPCESWDIPLPEIITPNAIFKSSLL